MKSNQIFPSKYIKAADLNGETPVTIKLVCLEMMKDQDGIDQEKPVMYFAEFSKGLVLNKTNWNAAAEIAHDEESDNWKGAKVILAIVRVEAFGKVTDGIRIVKPRSQAPNPFGDVNAQLESVESEMPY